MDAMHEQGDDPTPFDDWLDLPDEVWMHILGCLDARALLAIGAACARLERLARDNALWIDRITADFYDDPFLVLPQGDLPFLIRDVYACRWLCRHDAAEITSSCTHASGACGRTALTKTLDANVTTIACGRFDDEGRLQGYGERRATVTDTERREPDCATYRGMFRDGVYHGWGVLEVHGRPHSDLHKHASCNKLIELYCNGLCTLMGTGDWTAYRMTRFVGEWADGLPHGDGVATYARTNGRHATYKGQWQCGLWHGRGWFSLSDGSHCGTDFVAGRPHGDVTLRRAGSPDYLFQGRLRGRMAQSGCFAFGDGTRLVVGACTGERVRATLHTAAGEVYDGDWDERHNGEAVDSATGRRIRLHDLVRQCTASKIDRAGRTWRGCTGYCLDTGAWRLPLPGREDIMERPRGFQEVTYPNGDVLCARWREGLVWITSFAISRACPDDQFAGVVMQGFVWAYSTDRRHENDEWIFWPHQRSHSQRDLFAAYVRSGLGPWSPAALAAYDRVL